MIENGPHFPKLIQK